LLPVQKLQKDIRVFIYIASFIAVPMTKSAYRLFVKELFLLCEVARGVDRSTRNSAAFAGVWWAGSASGYCSVSWKYLHSVSKLYAVVSIKITFHQLLVYTYISVAKKW